MEINKEILKHLLEELIANDDIVVNEFVHEAHTAPVSHPTYSGEAPTGERVLTIRMTNTKVAEAFYRGEHKVIS